MTSRAYRPGDFARMLGLVADLWPDGRHGIGYAFMAQRLPYEDEWDARLWFDGDDLVAFAWATRWRERRGLSYEYRDVGLFPELLAWAQPETTTAKSGDADAGAVLREHGFAHDEDANSNRWNARALDRVDEPRVPDGYRLTTMADHVDFSSRAAAHRSAFTRPGSTSRFTDAVYEAVRREAPWRADLDCVAVGPDGEVAAFALAWLDDRHRVGELEPVGVRLEDQRRGLGRAVSLFALQRLRDSGADTALVGSSAPVPQRLYESIGFRELWRDDVFARA
ncbi:MAG TPA: GNAT family N-acetyltransferase [Gaiellaceae bacterium]